MSNPMMVGHSQGYDFDRLAHRLSLDALLLAQDTGVGSYGDLSGPVDRRVRNTLSGEPQPIRGGTVR
jgi:hypothetical protein